MRLQRVKNADFASFCLDRVTFSLKSGGDFLKMFEEELIQAEKQYEGVLKLEPEYLRQRKVIVTPTLFKVCDAHHEETNRVIR